MNILVAQLDAQLGGMDANIDKLLEVVEYTRQTDIAPDLVVAPPFYVTGFPLQGLVYSDSFLHAAEHAYNRLAREVEVPVLTVCYVTEFDADSGSALIVEDKICLFREGRMDILEDNSDPFYEMGMLQVGDAKVAVLFGDADEIADVDIEADVLVNMVDDTYDIQRADIVSADKIAIDSEFARESGVWMLRSACVGAQDSAVYPGGAYAITPDGQMATDCILFDEALLSLSIEQGGEWSASLEEVEDRDYGFSVHMDETGLDDEMADWGAICLATRDYVLKNGFTDVVIGMSGGLDSSAVAVIAADAIGSEHVHGVLMPSMYSSAGSIDDSLALAQNMGIDTRTISIMPPFEAFDAALAEACGGELKGLARENLQARIRTVYLMALSNTYGWMLLNTGNKSEAAMGYSTLYGDTAGAFAPLGNVYKTRIYELCEWRNEQGDAVPQNVLDKAPSAELHENQKDEDTLPPYEILDGICNLYLEYDYSADMIVEEGFDRETVNRVLRLITRNEYKRASEPLGPWIDGISLSDDRRWPITNGYVDVSKG